MFQQKVYTPKTSFSQAPSLQQLMSYLLFLLQILIFYIIIQKHITNPTTRIGIIVAYSISIIVHLISTLLVSLSDPSDEQMIKYHNDRQKQMIPNLSVSTKDIGNSLYCQHCCSYVKKASRHCKICQRCVEYFDHHCIWINNCIGGKNYKIFALMLVFTFTTLAIYLGSICIIWAQHSYEDYIIEMGFVWGSGIIVIVLLLLIMNLGILHVYLCKIGMTTFQYIMLDRPTTSSINSYPAMNKQEITQQNLQYNLTNTNTNTSTDKSNKTNLKPQIQMQIELTEVPKMSTSNKIIQIKQQKQQIFSQISSNSFSAKSAKHKRNQIAPIMAQQKKSNIFQQEKQSKMSQVSGRSKVSHFFANNRSLKMLIRSEADLPYEEVGIVGELGEQQRKQRAEE